MKSFFCALLLVFLTGCTAVEGLSNRTTFPYSAGEILVSKAKGGCLIQIFDAITTDMVGAFKLALDDFKSRNCESRWITLASPGGSVSAAFQIGNLIRDNGLNTQLLADGGECSSACGIMFIAGVRRGVNQGLIGGGNIGFHQISVTDAKGNKSCLQQPSPAYTALERYANRMLPQKGAETFVKMVGSTSCHQMQQYRYVTLLDAGIVTGKEGAGIRLF
jgi:hypothetical protein